MGAFKSQLSHYLRFKYADTTLITESEYFITVKVCRLEKIGSNEQSENE